MIHLISLPAGCISCNAQVQDALYNSGFLPNFFKMISGFIILTVIVVVLSYFSFKKYRTSCCTELQKNVPNPVPLSVTAIILGIGIGGFIDGIFMHQILQWHGMFTNKLTADTVAGKSVNMFWDGIFHLLTLITVIIGVISLTRLLRMKNINTSPKLVWGGFFAGWGLFNLVEGLLHHHILKFHNVHEFSQNPDLWNYAFLLSSLIFMVVGFYIIFHRKYYPKSIEH